MNLQSAPHIESQKSKEMLLSTNYRIEPTRTQDAALGEMLADFCHLYKAALEQRSAAYDTGVSLPCNEQIVPLPVMRRERAETQGRVVLHGAATRVAQAGSESVGIDLGLAALVALSNGVTVARPGWTK